MSMPFYVSPEQVMKDKADFARKTITRIRSGVVITCEAGILFVAPNPSRALRKFSELYDRIAFAAVGRYNEFESLRKAGVRYADMTGFQYDRRDVTARGLADWYAQVLGTLQKNLPPTDQLPRYQQPSQPRNDRFDQLSILSYTSTVPFTIRAIENSCSTRARAQAERRAASAGSSSNR